MAKYERPFIKKIVTPATAFAFNIETGFEPRHVKVFNVTDRTSMEWFYGETRSLIKKATAGSQSIGSATAAGTNTGSAASPTSAGTYTGKATGTLTIRATTTGEAGTAKVKGYFPDGTVTAEITTGATTVAQAIGQGVTFAITSGTGDDVVVGDYWTIALVAAGSVIIDGTATGISVGMSFPHAIDTSSNITNSPSTRKGTCVTVGLNTTVNVAAKTLVVFAE